MSGCDCCAALLVPILAARPRARPPSAAELTITRRRRAIAASTWGESHKIGWTADVRLAARRSGRAAGGPAGPAVPVRRPLMQLATATTGSPTARSAIKTEAVAQHHRMRASWRPALGARGDLVTAHLFRRSRRPFRQSGRGRASAEVPRAARRAPRQRDAVLRRQPRGDERQPDQRAGEDDGGCGRAASAPSSPSRCPRVLPAAASSYASCYRLHPGQRHGRPAAQGCPKLGYALLEPVGRGQLRVLLGEHPRRGRP